MRLCELRDKEVINTCTCTKLGSVVDLEINECEGCVEAIIVPGPCKTWCILGTDSEYVIPYSCIKNIGEDIILVEIREEKFLKKCEE
ncbi:MAG: YlmC/YmxH family sporulation protein [Hespellia sp.]|nr:YlmC/YmxH family sporulation protein [Hespellia sp.]